MSRRLSAWMLFWSASGVSTAVVGELEWGGSDIQWGGQSLTWGTV